MQYLGDTAHANAKYLAEHGAALVIPESQLHAGSLAKVIQDLGNDRPRLIQMAQRARARAVTDSTRRVAELCLEAANDQV